MVSSLIIKKDTLVLCIDKKIKSLVIPKEVRRIGSSAFSGCTELESIKIPDSVGEIGKNAFEGCSNLKYINLPSLNVIESGVFKNCSLITSIEIPDSVEIINSNAFAGCINLYSIEIPDSVKYLGSSIFEGCFNLKQVKLSSSLERIPDSLFAKCISLESIDLPDSINLIGSKAFSWCQKLSKIKIPASVKYIGRQAFDRSGLTSKRAIFGNYYKATNPDLTCSRKFQYTLGKKYIELKPIFCYVNGFHSCKNLFDIFNYYYGECNRDFIITECTPSGIINESPANDTCIASSEIRIDRILTWEEVIQILNN